MSKSRRVIKQYLLHSYPEQVQSEFAEWFASPFDRAVKDEVLLNEWENLTPSEDKKAIKQSYKAVWERIGRSESRVHRMSLFRSILRAAAVIVVAVALTAMVKILASNTSRVEWQEVYVGKGESRTIELADGSVMELAAGSRLIYPSKFTDDVRRVYLSGEAYADIAKDERHRFVISAEQIDVIVHGTQFMVRSYDANSEVEVMLLEGSVDMQTKGLVQNRVVRMHPGDLVKLDKRTGRVSCENVPQDMFNDNFKARTLTFVNSRLGDIASQLERVFNVRIVVDNASLAEDRYYSAFVNDESLDRILSTLEQSGRMSYYWKNGEIHLYNK